MEDPDRRRRREEFARLASDPDFYRAEVEALEREVQGGGLGRGVRGAEGAERGGEGQRPEGRGPVSDETQQLREEVRQLRAEVQQLRDEVRQLRASLG